MFERKCGADLTLFFNGTKMSWCRTVFFNGCRTVLFPQMHWHMHLYFVEIWLFLLCTFVKSCHSYIYFYSGNLKFDTWLCQTKHTSTLRPEIRRCCRWPSLFLSCTDHILICTYSFTIFKAPALDDTASAWWIFPLLNNDRRRRIFLFFLFLVSNLQNNIFMHFYLP